MITFPPSVLELYDQGRIKTMGMIRFEFGSGTYCFCKSDQSFTHNGLVYQPGGIIEVSEFSGGTGLYAEGFTITLAASPDDGLTPQIMQTIENEDYRDRPVYVMDADFHPDTGELLHVQVMKRGYLDVIDHVDDGGSGYTMTATCESRSLDYSRTNARKRNVIDQNRRQQDDKFFEHTAKRGREEVYWGRKKQGQSPSAASILGKKLSFFR